MSGLNIPFGKIKTIYENIMDQMLANDCVSYEVSLYFPPLIEDCSNCEYQGFGTTHNIYKHGGPAPFNFGQCPLCGGQGKKEVEYIDTIRLRLYYGGRFAFSKRAWSGLPVPFQNAEGELLAIGNYADLEKIKLCNYMVTFTDDGKVGNNATGNLYHRYELAADPYPHGFGKTKYLISYWERK